VIYKCENVLECVVVGKEDPVHGEVIAAVVAPRDSTKSERLVEEVRAVCKAHLSSYKVPSIIQVVERIPQTHSGKLLRKDVRKQIAEQV
jgi:acyl-coenzyme A synthetase/AMP-(fatty) acid ligase